MDLDTLFMSLLILSTLLCALVSGLVFAFAVVVMPGIKNLTDSEFIKAFQVMDKIIQNNQPLFMFVWVGSALTLVISAALGIWQLDGVARVLLVAITIVYVVGVQLPTISINIPLNKKLQSVDTGASGATQQTARKDFEKRWIFWNSLRTAVATLVSVLLMVLLYSL